MSSSSGAKTEKMQTKMAVESAILMQKSPQKFSDTDPSNHTGCRGNILPKSSTFGACCCFYICIQFRNIARWFFYQLFVAFITIDLPIQYLETLKIYLLYSKIFHLMRYCFGVTPFIFVSRNSFP